MAPVLPAAPTQSPVLSPAPGLAPQATILPLPVPQQAQPVDRRPLVELLPAKRRVEVLRAHSQSRSSVVLTPAPLTQPLQARDPRVELLPRRWKTWSEVPEPDEIPDTSFFLRDLLWHCSFD